MLDGILRERGPRLNVWSLGWQRTGEMNTPGRSGIDRRDAVNATLRLLRLGEERMSVRSPLAAIVGYLAFFGASDWREVQPNDRMEPTSSTHSPRMVGDPVR